ncbi:RNA-binding protein 44 isoform X2 [Amphiprion ocellaris]|uniref:RNA-binding protein 44 isoform X2 n=1 Tax=Amphiprion ocellaris TaxID=80972 RepID=UPI002411850C|nr:RNA-binding protein 44 isoform X2 [Amphiprion ocellaris]
MVADELGNVSFRTSEEPQQLYPAAERSRRPDDGSTNISQIKKKMIKTRRVASVILKDGRFLQTKQEGNQTAVGEEVSRSELWFDAEEDLELPEVEQNPAAEPADESVPEEGSVLRVSSLPGDVTMRDLMLLLKDYEASEVKISALKDNQRVAMVTVSGPQAAKAAVEELDGRRLKDHTLHVEHIRGNENLQDLPRPGPSENLQDLPRPGPSENQPSSPGRTPLISSTGIRKVVFISPTARGTCVPQHYGTMGSFDTLMSELLQRHPEVGRQKIADALVELRRKYPGVLTGLPLQTIREMTSQLLTRPETASQI